MDGFGLYRATVKLLVNGEARDVPEGITIAKLLDILGTESGLVAVEVNTAVVRRARHAEASLKDGDQVEVVTFVGGG
jgi:thiamine biosynthesis protein ThiS